MRGVCVGGVAVQLEKKKICRTSAPACGVAVFNNRMKKLVSQELLYNMLALK